MGVTAIPGIGGGCGDTVPMPWSILAAAERRVIDHVKYVVWPAEICAGNTRNSAMSGCTLTVDEAVAVPPGPTAVIVYVVVTVG